MMEVIDVHFAASSYENRKAGIAILVDIAELFPKGIFNLGHKKTESNMKSCIVENIATEMSEEFERQRLVVPGFNGSLVQDEESDKYKRDNLSNKRRLLRRRIFASVVDKPSDSNRITYLSLRGFSIGATDNLGKGPEHKYILRELTLVFVYGNLH